MTLYNWFCLLGIPTIFSMLIGYIIKRIARSDKETKSIKYGIQALLRDRLIQLYRYCSEEKGYATISERENFINMYNQYHNLGSNGVMDDTKIKFLNLPTTKE